MLFNLDIECLWLHVYKWWVIHTWDRLGRHQVMKVSCQLSELSSRCLLLPFLLLNVHLKLIFLKLLAHLFIFVLYVAQIGLACIEVMLVFPAVITSIAK